MSRVTIVRAGRSQRVAPEIARALLSKGWKLDEGDEQGSASFVRYMANVEPAKKAPKKSKTSTK